MTTGFKSLYRDHKWVKFVVRPEVFLLLDWFSAIYENQHFQIPIQPSHRELGRKSYQEERGFCYLYIVKSVLPSSAFGFLSSSVGESGSMFTLLPYLSSVGTLQLIQVRFY